MTGSSREQLLTLAERCEQKQVGSRELDAEINAILFGGRPAHDFTDEDPASRLRRSYGAGTVFDHSDPWTNNGHVLCSMVRDAPRYTTCFYAAMTLADGSLLLHMSDIGADGLPLVKLVADTKVSPIVEYSGIAATKELSWCAAALRVLAAKAADVVPA